jgi:hypothetical protein
MVEPRLGWQRAGGEEPVQISGPAAMGAGTRGGGGAAVAAGSRLPRGRPIAVAPAGLDVLYRGGRFGVPLLLLKDRQRQEPENKKRQRRGPGVHQSTGTSAPMHSWGVHQSTGQRVHQSTGLILHRIPKVGHAWAQPFPSLFELDHSGGV